MTIRKQRAKFDPSDPVTTLMVLAHTLASPMVHERMRKVLPPPDYDLDGMIMSLDRIRQVIEADGALRVLMGTETTQVEVEDMPDTPLSDDIRPMPLRELVSDEERRRRRDMVVKVGRCLYGEQWQTPLARALSEAGGRPMTQNRIAHWLHDGVQARPVPGWVMPALRAVSEARIEELLANVAEVRALYAAEDKGEEAAA